MQKNPAAWDLSRPCCCVRPVQLGCQRRVTQPWLAARQVLGCGKRMDDADAPEGDYYQRYRVCQAHLTLSVLLMQSVPHRFCQVTALVPERS